jgi:hypothetical protein
MGVAITQCFRVWIVKISLGANLEERERKGRRKRVKREREKVRVQEKGKKESKTDS